MSTQIFKLIKSLEKQFNNNEDCFTIFDKNHNIIFSNETSKALYKLDFETYENGYYTEKYVKTNFSKAVNEKKFSKHEVYIPELDKTVITTYSPLLSNDGSFQYILETLTDITQKVKLKEELKKSKENYKKILDNFPYPFMIVQDNHIIQVNNLLCDYFNETEENLLGSNIFNFCTPKYTNMLQKKLHDILKEKKQNDIYESSYRLPNGALKSTQIVTSYIEIDDKPSIYILFRDTSRASNELYKAASIQKKSLERGLIKNSHINIHKIYIPAQIVSGDFFRLINLDDNHVIGIMLDSKGKGLTASLNISALDILFLLETQNINDPLIITRNINKILIDNYPDTYIAATIFSIDFTKNELCIVGAGINKFYYKPANEKLQEIIVKGPFLGMFPNIDFDVKNVKFNPNDTFFIFTDGFDFVLQDLPNVSDYIENQSLDETKQYIEEYLYEELISNGELKDDCTVLGIEINNITKN